MGRGPCSRTTSNKILAFEVLHDDERCAVGQRPDVEHARHVFAFDLDRGARFTRETTDQLLVRRALGPQELERDFLAELDVRGGKNKPHSARANEIVDLVFPGDDVAGLKRHVDRFLRHRLVSALGCRVHDFRFTHRTSSILQSCQFDRHESNAFRNSTRSSPPSLTSNRAIPLGRQPSGGYGKFETSRRADKQRRASTVSDSVVDLPRLAHAGANVGSASLLAVLRPPASCDLRRQRSKGSANGGLRFSDPGAPPRLNEPVQAPRNAHKPAPIMIHR